MKQKKLMFNFFVNRNWSKLTDTRKRAKILADNRKSHHPIETLFEQMNHKVYLPPLSTGALLKLEQIQWLRYRWTDQCL